MLRHSVCSRVIATVILYAMACPTTASIRTFTQFPTPSIHSKLATVVNTNINHANDRVSCSAMRYGCLSTHECNSDEIRWRRSVDRVEAGMILHSCINTASGRLADVGSDEPHHICHPFVQHLGCLSPQRKVPIRWRKELGFATTFMPG